MTTGREPVERVSVDDLCSPGVVFQIAARRRWRDKLSQILEIPLRS